MFCQKCGRDLGSRSANFCVFCGASLNSFETNAMPVSHASTYANKPGITRTVVEPFYPNLEKQTKAKEHLSSFLFALFAVFLFLSVSLSVLQIGKLDIKSDSIGGLSDLFSYKNARIIDMLIYMSDIGANLLVSLFIFAVYFCARAEEGFKATRRALTLLQLSLWYKLIVGVISFAVEMYACGFNIKLASIAKDAALKSTHIFYAVLSTVVIVATFVLVLLICKAIKCFKKNLAGTEYKKRVPMLAIIAMFAYPALLLSLIPWLLFGILIEPDINILYVIIMLLLNTVTFSLLASFLVRYRVAIGRIIKKKNKMQSVTIGYVPFAPSDFEEKLEDSNEEDITLFKEINTDTEI